MTPPAESVLYFPSIEFADDGWVKAALICWDHVYRIVPPGYSPADSDEIRRAIDAGVVRNIAIDDDERSETLLAYTGFIDAQHSLPHGIESNSESHFLHPEKIDERLYSRLEEQAKHVFADRRLELPAGLARGYMYFLSQSVARRRNLCRATDDRDSWAISSYFSEDGNFSDSVYSPGAAMHYSSLSIRDLVPTSVGSVPMKAIIDFTQTKKDEKHQFRSALHSLSERIASVQNHEQRDQVLADYCKSVEGTIEQLRRATHDFLPDGQLYSLFVVGLPTSLTALGALGMGTNEPYDIMRIGASMFIGAVAAYHSADVITTHNRHPSIESYLIDLDDRMARERRFPSFHRAFEEFMND